MKPLQAGTARQEGFVAILLVTLLPALLALASLFFVFCQLLTLKQEAQHLCREHLLRAQQSMIAPLGQLMKLNPMARGLIIRKRVAMAQAALAVVTVNPALGARAAADLAKAYRNQRRLSSLQKVLISRAYAGAAKESLSLQRNSIAAFARRKRAFYPFIELSTSYMGVPVPRLAVRKTNPKETASPYKLAQDFERKQKMEIRWQIGFRLPFFRSFAPEAHGHQILEGKCAATLIGKGKTWQAALKEDR